MKQVQMGVIAYRDSEGKIGVSKPIFKVLNEDEQDLEKEMLNRVSEIFEEKIYKENQLNPKTLIPAIFK